MGIHRSELNIYIGFSPAIHLQCSTSKNSENEALEFLIMIGSVFSMEYSFKFKHLIKRDSLTKLCVACLSAPVPLSAWTPNARPSLIAGLSAPAQPGGQHTVYYKWILYICN
jgi:hypothetical protein